jgi:transcriptional regulator with XRE-family HTH domain
MAVMNPIVKYLEATEISQAQFARLTGTREGQVSAWVRGTRKPSLAEAFRLEKATGGAIPAASWVNGRRAA